mmetsp:Transcript_16354/g.40206  ORF Transcript_16354/g.40206 Transcript_16354/m.40206 type:complete len:317 (-) Transcript_16354:370-1320(-)
MPPPQAKQKPNDACACGSAKKYKKCCGVGGGPSRPSGAAAPDKGGVRRKDPQQAMEWMAASEARVAAGGSQEDEIATMKAISKSFEPKLLAQIGNQSKGFGFGKLLGAEAAVFAAACFAKVDATRDACNDMPENHPQCALFALQTPHLRLELIAQVAVGLLVPDAPFPEDLPELHATYLAVWDSVLTQVEMEIDNDEGPATTATEETPDEKVFAQGGKAGAPPAPAPANPPVPSPIDWENQSGGFLNHDLVLMVQQRDCGRWRTKRSWRGGWRKTRRRRQRGDPPGVRDRNPRVPLRISTPCQSSSRCATWEIAAR